MRGIRVKLEKANSPEPFEIRYLNRVKTLAITKEGEKKWSYGATLDGILLLDANQGKELVNVELMMAKRAWRRARIENIFRYKYACRLFLPGIEDSAELEDLPVATRFDTEHHCLQIFLSNDLDAIECYRLAKGCDVLIRNNILLGFQLTPCSGNSYLYDMLQ